MANTEKRPKPLEIGQLRKIIHEAIESGIYSGYQETLHARFDHIERSIDVNDVLIGLRRKDRILKRSPEFNEEFWQWKYTILTKDVENALIVIVVAVDTKNKSFEVLTRWRE